MNNTSRVLNANGLEGVVSEKNYVSSGFETGTVSGYSLFNTTLTSGVPTGSVGAGAASLTLGVTSTNPLSQTFSLQMVAAGAVTAGQGFISQAFTVDGQDLGKVLNFKLAYQAISGSTNANWSGTLGSQSFAVYVRDVTAGTWIQPTGFLGMNTAPGSGYVLGSFQSSVTVGQQYQIAIICLQATAGAITINFDSFTVSNETAISSTSPAVNIYGSTSSAAVTANVTLIPYTTLINATNANWNGTVFTASTSGFYRVSASIYSAAAAYQVLIHKNGARYAEGTIGNSSSPSLVTVTIQLNAGQTLDIRSAISVTLANSTTNAVFSIEQVSNLGILSGDGGQVIVAIANGNAGSPTANTPIIFPTIVKDTNFGYNVATGRYLVQDSGYYEVEVFLSGTVGSNAIISAYVDGVAQNPALGLMFNASGIGFGSGTVYANAGQLIDVRLGQNATINTTNSGVSFKKVSGASVIGANTTIASRATKSSTQTISTTQACLFDTVAYDLSSCFSTVSGGTRFTSPVSGIYDIDAQLYSSVGGGEAIRILKNGTLEVSGTVFLAGTTASRVSSKLQLNAGEFIEIRGSNSISVIASPTGNYFNVSKI